PAASPTIACSWRRPDRTSRAWVPTDAVEPTTMNLRLLTPTDDAKVLWDMTRQPSGERRRPPMVRRAGAPGARHAASLLGTVASVSGQCLHRRRGSAAGPVWFGARVPLGFGTRRPGWGRW